MNLLIFTLVTFATTVARSLFDETIAFSQYISTLYIIFTHNTIVGIFLGISDATFFT